MLLAREPFHEEFTPLLPRQPCSVRRNTFPGVSAILSMAAQGCKRRALPRRTGLGTSPKAGNEAARGGKRGGR